MIPQNIWRPCARRTDLSFMKEFTYILAVDPGGTKCDALLVAAGGTLLEHYRLRDGVMGGRHPQIIRRAIKQVLKRHKPAPLRVVTFVGRRQHSLQSWRKLLPQPWRSRSHILPSWESISALAATGHSFGMVVAAGTGAFVAMRTSSGRETSLDGIGPVLGDSGSGYSIGREALRALAREMQLQRPATRLCERVLQACDCRDLRELVKFSLQPRDRSRIASLSKIVDEEARAGDRLARRLLRDGATAMAGTVRDLVKHLRIAGKEFPLVSAGSVATHSDIYWRELCRQVRQIAPRVKPMRVPLPPVAGLAAIGLANATATAKLFATLKKELII